MNPGKLQPAATIVLALLWATSAMAEPAATPNAASPEQVVRGFLRDVRSGADPGAAGRYFAPQVAAHQVTSEAEATILRSPDDYAGHVREFLATFGRFSLQIEELLAQGDRVYVRWRQVGQHLASINGEAPTGCPLTELTAAVYRVESGRIVEYWIQSDRKGLELQLARLREPCVH